MNTTQTFRLRLGAGQHIVDATLEGRLGTTAKLAYNGSWGYFDPIDGACRGGEGLALGTYVMDEDRGALQTAVRLLGTAEAPAKEAAPEKKVEVKQLSLGEQFMLRLEALSGIPRAVLEDVEQLRKITWESFLALRAALEKLFTEIGAKDLHLRMEDVYDDLAPSRVPDPVEPAEVVTKTVIEKEPAGVEEKLVEQAEPHSIAETLQKERELQELVDSVEFVEPARSVKAPESEPVVAPDKEEPAAPEPVVEPAKVEGKPVEKPTTKSQPAAHAKSKADKKASAPKNS